MAYVVKHQDQIRLVHGLFKNNRNEFLSLFRLNDGSISHAKPGPRSGYRRLFSDDSLVACGGDNIDVKYEGTLGKAVVVEEGHSVFVDEDFKQSEHRFTVKGDAGRYRFKSTIKRPGYADHERVIEVEIGQSFLQKDIMPQGGSMVFGEIRLNFPKGTFNGDATVTLTKDERTQKFPPSHIGITPVFNLKSSEPLQNPVQVILTPACGYRTSMLRDNKVDVLHLPDGSEEWEVIARRSLQEGKIAFDCVNFSPIVAALQKLFWGMWVPPLCLCLYTDHVDCYYLCFIPESLASEDVIPGYFSGLRLRLSLTPLCVRLNDVVTARLACRDARNYYFLPSGDFSFQINDSFLNSKKAASFSCELRSRDCERVNFVNHLILKLSIAKNDHVVDEQAFVHQLVPDANKKGGKLKDTRISPAETSVAKPEFEAFSSSQRYQQPNVTLVHRTSESTSWSRPDTNLSTWPLKKLHVKERRDVGNQEHVNLEWDADMVAQLLLEYNPDRLVQQHYGTRDGRPYLKEMRRDIEEQWTIDSENPRCKKPASIRDPESWSGNINTQKTVALAGCSVFFQDASFVPTIIHTNARPSDSLPQHVINISPTLLIELKERLHMPTEVFVMSWCRDKPIARSDTGNDSVRSINACILHLPLYERKWHTIANLQLRDAMIFSIPDSSSGYYTVALQRELLGLPYFTIHSYLFARGNVFVFAFALQNSLSERELLNDMDTEGYKIQITFRTMSAQLHETIQPYMEELPFIEEERQSKIYFAMDYEEDVVIDIDFVTTRQRIRRIHSFATDTPVRAIEVVCGIRQNGILFDSDKFYYACHLPDEREASTSLKQKVKQAAKDGLKREKQLRAATSPSPKARIAFANTNRRIKKVLKDIPPIGGCIEIDGCKVTFPEGAVSRSTKVEIGVEVKASNSEYMWIVSPTIRCKADVTVFRKQVSIELPTWLDPTAKNPSLTVMRYGDGYDDVGQKISSRLVSFDTDGKVTFRTKKFSDFITFVKKKFGYEFRFETFLFNNMYGCFTSVLCCHNRTLEREITDAYEGDGYVKTIVKITPIMGKASDKVGIELACTAPELPDPKLIEYEVHLDDLLRLKKSYKDHAPQSSSRPLEMLEYRISRKNERQKLLNKIDINWQITMRKAQQKHGARSSVNPDAAPEVTQPAVTSSTFNAPTTVNIVAGGDANTKNEDRTVGNVVGKTGADMKTEFKDTGLIARRSSS